jgi:hypothetical protein
MSSSPGSVDHASCFWKVVGILTLKGGREEGKHESAGKKGGQKEENEETKKVKK